mgnify:CR=1 FL=1
MEIPIRLRGVSAIEHEIHEGGQNTPNSRKGFETFPRDGSQAVEILVRIHLIPARDLKPPVVRIFEFTKLESQNTPNSRKGFETRNSSPTIIEHLFRSEYT